MDEVERLYDRFDCVRSFGEDFRAHLVTGHILSTPTAFVMGRAVCSTAPLEEIRNPWVMFPRHQQDAWLVYAMAGSSENNLLHLFPYPLMYVALERRGQGRLRFYHFERFTRCASTILSGTKSPRG